MADNMLFIGWGAAIPGREERSLEVFNEAVGFYGRMQQEGRIEKLDIVLLTPHGGGLEGYMELHGTVAQLNALKEDDEFRRILVDANLVVQELGLVDGMTNEGVAREMSRYQQAIGQIAAAAG